MKAHVLPCIEPLHFAALAPSSGQSSRAALTILLFVGAPYAILGQLLLSNKKKPFPMCCGMPKVSQHVGPPCCRLSAIRQLDF
eukprot:126986-Chlamydomonas_euryale.AAC.9